MSPSGKPLPIEETPGGCWRWTGPLHTTGHPVRYEDGREIKVRREIWEATWGQIPPKLRLKPWCGDPLCVAPRHVGFVRPRTAMAYTATPAKTHRAIKERLREFAQEAKTGFDRDQPLTLGIERAEVIRWAQAYLVPEVEVLAAWAECVRDMVGSKLRAAAAAAGRDDDPRKLTYEEHGGGE